MVPMLESDLAMVRLAVLRKGSVSDLLMVISRKLVWQIVG